MEIGGGGWGWGKRGEIKNPFSKFNDLHTLISIWIYNEGLIRKDWSEVRFAHHTHT